jgi:hypothetical protein
MLKEAQLRSVSYGVQTLLTREASKVSLRKADPHATRCITDVQDAACCVVLTDPHVGGVAAIP